MIKTGEDKSLALLSEPAWTDQSYETARAGDVDFPELRAPAHPCITHTTASSREEKLPTRSICSDFCCSGVWTLLYLLKYHS